RGRRAARRGAHCVVARRRTGRGGAIRRRCRARAFAGPPTPHLWPRRPGRAPVHRHPPARALSPRARHRGVELSRPRPRHHHRAMAEPAALTRRGGSPAVQAKTFPALPEPVPLARFSAAEDLRAAIALWAAWLGGERRASAHTIAAYGRDLTFFLDFLTVHLGEPPGLASLGLLLPADFRAYLAHRAAV